MPTEPKAVAGTPSFSHSGHSDTTQPAAPSWEEAPDLQTRQLRVRLTRNAAKKYASIPPAARSRVVSLILLAAASKLDLRQLLEVRRELSSLGNLLNQSLRSSWGSTPDAEACKAIVKHLEGLLG